MNSPDAVIAVPQATPTLPKVVSAAQTTGVRGRTE